MEIVNDDKIPQQKSKLKVVKLHHTISMFFGVKGEILDDFGCKWSSPNLTGCVGRLVYSPLDFYGKRR